MNMKVVSLTAVLVAAISVPAFAHHSFAMFDAQKTITLEGTVKELEWTNPAAHDGQRSESRPACVVGVRDELTGTSRHHGHEGRLRALGRQGLRDVPSDEGRIARRTIHAGEASQRTERRPRERSRRERRELNV